jgi:hypothetical protein
VDPDDPDEYVRWLAGFRLPRSVGTYEYAGDFLLCLINTHPDVRMRWSQLPEHERDRRWIDDFRMSERDFDELLLLCSPYMKEQSGRRDFR